jgi:hypothetical protein
VAVGGVPQDREEGPDLGDRNHLDALGGRRVDRYPRGAVTVLEQDLREQASRRVAHDDRWFVELTDDALEVLDDGGDGQRLYRGGVLAQRLDLDLKAWVGGG